MEGAVNAAKGDIVNLKNEITSQLSDIIKELGFPDPDVEFADSSDDNSNILIELGYNRYIRDSQVIVIEIVADDDITIRIPTMLSRVLLAHDYYKLSGIDDAVAALQNIKKRIYANLIKK